MNKDKSILKVAYILRAFPLDSETFIINEILELKKQGMNVNIFSFGRPINCIHPEAKELIKDTYYVNDKGKLWRILLLFYAHIYFLVKNPIHYLRVFRFVSGKDKEAFFLFLRISYLALLLSKSKVNAIHAHFAVSVTECTMLISMITKIPYSFTIHAFDIFKEPRLIKEKIERARFVICISEFNKEFVMSRFLGEEEGKLEKKLKVIHCGVDLDKLSAYTSKVNEENGRKPFTIISTGRLVEKKGLRYLIEAVRILVSNGCADFICYIIGEGPLRDELNSLVLRSGIEDRVKFLGALPQERVFYNLSGADLFVLPCVTAEDGDMDGIPVSLMEAMALKKPVISTSISAIPELVKEGAGILVPPKDSKALAEAIDNVMSLDIEEKIAMGKRGYEVVSREFSLQKNVSLIKKHLSIRDEVPTREWI